MEKTKGKKGRKNRKYHSINKSETRAKEIAKKWQIEVFKEMKNSRKKTGSVVIKYKGESTSIEKQEKRNERIADLKRRQ